MAAGVLFQVGTAQAVTCSYDATSRTVHLDMTSPSFEHVSTYLVGDQIWWHDVSSWTDAPCADATLSTTDEIDVTGGSEADDFELDETGGALTTRVVVDLGGTADDRLIVRGTPGDDTITAGSDGISLTDAGTLDVSGPSATSNVELWGGDGDDALRASGGYGTGDPASATVRIDGGNGDDRLRGGMGDDVIYGDAGSDKLAGNAGADSLHGGSGADTIVGGAGTDSVFGEGGADTLLLQDGEVDHVYGNLTQDDVQLDPSDTTASGLVAGRKQPTKHA